MIDNVSPCLVLRIKHYLSREEYDKLVDICVNAIVQNIIDTKGTYFKEVNHDLSYYDENEFVIRAEIFAKGAYFDDRMLLYYHHIKGSEYGCICLDDHSIGVINLKPVYLMRKYLYEIGAYDDEKWFKRL